MYLFGVFWLFVATAALPVLPDPPTLSNLKHANHHSKMRTYVNNPPTDLANQRQKLNFGRNQNDHYLMKKKKAVIFENPPQGEVPPNPSTLPCSLTEPQDSEVIVQVADTTDDEEVIPNLGKIATIVTPTPPELPPCDYSILANQIADHKHKFKNLRKQEAHYFKKEKQPVKLEDLLKVEVPSKPSTLPCTLTEPQDSEVPANIPCVETDIAQIADTTDEEEVKPNSGKIATVVIPTPPKLPPFDYSILRKQMADQKQKLKNSRKQEAHYLKKQKQPVKLENPLKVEVSLNPSTLPCAITEPQDSEVPANTPCVESDIAQVADTTDEEEVKPNPGKIATVVIPTPPKLPPFDYSILRKQVADHKQKFKNSRRQKALYLKEEKQPVILENPHKCGVPPNPSTLPCDLTEPQDSEVPANIPCVETDIAQVADTTDKEEVKSNPGKIATVVIPTPPELPPCDYSILANQIADQKHKLKNCRTQEAHYFEKEKQPVKLENPLKVEFPPKPSTLPCDLTEPQDSEVPANIPCVETDIAQVADTTDEEEVKSNPGKIATVVIPTPPELPPCDYSILENQIADQKHKLKNCRTQEAHYFEKEKQPVRLENPLKVEVPPKPSTLPCAVTEPQDSEVPANNPCEETDIAQVADTTDEEEVKSDPGKIATVVIPTPPKLPPFDYSILRKQMADQKQKFRNSRRQEALYLKKEKQPVILENPLKLEVPPNPSTLPCALTEPQNLEVPANIPCVETDIAQVADTTDEEEVKPHLSTIATIVTPTPPELPPCDYSILANQIADQKHKFKNCRKHEAHYFKKEKQPVKLENLLKVEVPPKPSTLPCTLTEPQHSEVPANIPCVETDIAQIADTTDEEEVKPNPDKIATVVIPTPPKLPPFDYSILRKQMADQKQKFNEELKKPKLIGEYKFIEDYKPIKKSKPCGESNPLEEIKKEAVECSEDSRVIAQLKIPSGPFLNKLKANCSPSPCFG